MVTVSPNGFKPVNQATILSKSNNSHLPKSHLARVLLYRRYHICFIICIFVGLLVCSQYMNNMQVEKLARVDMAEKLQNELYIIIEKTIDAVHYNWQKLYEGSSGTRPIEEMALNASLEYMISSNYRDIIYKAFSQKLASDILYADVCKYASDPAYC